MSCFCRMIKKNVGISYENSNNMYKGSLFVFDKQDKQNAHHEYCTTIDSYTHWIVRIEKGACKLAVHSNLAMMD